MKGKLLLSFLLLLMVAHAVFVPEDYFYENESPEVRSESWTVDGETYKVYYFDGKPTFLVFNNTPIADKGLIQYVVEAHYRDLYPLSDELLENIANYILAFNNSRFDRDNPYRMEEQECRNQLGEAVSSSLPPKTLEKILNSPGFQGDIYKYYAALLVGNDLVPPGYDEEYVAEQVRYFFTNSDALSNAIAEAISLLGDIYQEDEALENKTDRLVELLQEIRTRANNLERARVLALTDREVCGSQGCLFLCPPMKYDYDSLNAAEELVDQLRSLVSDYLKWREVADSIVEETNDRLFYVFATHETDKIEKALQPLNASWQNAKEEIREFMKVVRDDALSTYYDQVEYLFTSIAEDLEKKEFNATEEKVENLTAMIEKAKERYLLLKDLYEEATNYKQLADVLERLIDDGEEVKETLDAKAELDRNFIPPFTYNTLKAFRDSYRQVVENLKEYYKQKGKKGDVLFGLKKFIGGAANGIYALLQALPAPVRAALSPSLPIATTALMAVSAFFTTIFVGSIAYVKLYRRLSKRKLLYFTLLAIVALIVGGASALVYFPVSSLTSVTDPLPFAEYLAKAKNATLVVFLGSSYDDAILSCALSTKREMESLGLEVSLMEIKGEQCEVDGKKVSREECLLSLTPPYIMYAPGSPSVEGSLVGEVHLIVNGNKETFEKCELRYYLALINQLKEVKG